MSGLLKTAFSLDVALEHLKYCRATGMSDAEILASIGAEVPEKPTTAIVIGAIEEAWIDLIIHRLKSERRP